MEEASFMHCKQRFDELIDQDLDFFFRISVLPAFQPLTHILVHEFEDQGETTCGLVTK